MRAIEAIGMPSQFITKIHANHSRKDTTTMTTRFLYYLPALDLDLIAIETTGDDIICALLPDTTYTSEGQMWRNLDRFDGHVAKRLGCTLREARQIWREKVKIAKEIEELKTRLFDAEY